MTTREVVLDGGSPWGFRMHGGADVQQPLRISRVNPGSKAALKGIREGDLITSINGKSTKEITNSEAHGLLKNAGDTLRLGLNEDCSGSPKRRQYKTVHQETHSETIKRSSITSTTYTVSNLSTNNIQSPSNSNNENLGAFEKGYEDGDGDAKLNGTSTTPNKIVSQRSTLSSNCSTPSTLPESEGVCQGIELRKQNARYTATSNRRGPACCDDGGNNNNSVTVTSSASDKAIMADNVIENSRTRRKRSRSSRKRSKRETNAKSDGDTKKITDDTVKITELTPGQLNEEGCEIVDSNKAIIAEVDSTTKSTTKKSTMIKSKSLEDNSQTVQITEVSSVQDDEKIPENTNAIIAEEDFEWEVTEENNEQPTILISPEDESNLRNFLEGLNLADSPQESVKHTYEKNTIDSIRSKKAKKRAALVQYFMPVYENPRYLEVISEEGSDLSDREQKNKDTKNNKETVVLVETKLYDNNSNMKEDNREVNKEHMFLVETNFQDSENLTEGICNTSVVEGSSAEVVYLEDSSSSDCDEKCDSKNDDGEKKEDLWGVCEENQAIPSSQLTPPPTPDSVSPKNEFKDEEKENGVLAAPGEYSNVISPPLSRRSPSVSSNGSSSRGTSLCTVQYNPSGSSLTDIASIVKDGDFLKDVCTPLSLRELCLKSITSLPFGADILQELADVSSTIEKVTNRSPREMLPLFRGELEKNKSILTVHLEKTLPSLNGELESNKSIVDLENHEMSNRNDGKWVGIPVEENPHVLLCLSPKQKKELDKCKKAPDEASSLLDLHDKFLNRRGYFERFATESELFAENPKNVDNANNALLAIIRETSPTKSSTLPSVTCGDSTCGPTDKDMYLYYVANDDVEQQQQQQQQEKSEPFTRNTNATLARCELKSENFNDARLKARDLSQWLQLARFKSTSDSNLNTIGDTRRIKQAFSITEIPKKTTPTEKESPQNVSFHISNPWRRASLPQELYKHQMQYILEKEREIQRELEKLEEEKRKLAAEMNSSPQREFEANKYYISRKGDIAIRNENDTERRSFTKPRPKSMPMAPTEFFRQQMYEEYMKKVTAREERKQHKVIKISTHPGTAKTNENVDQNERSTFGDVIHISGIEDEFMGKVKERMEKLGLHRDESDEIPAIAKSDDEAEPVLVLDGDSLTDSKKLPKHLQEFIDITKEVTKDGAHGVWSPGQSQKNSVEEVIKKTEEKVKEKKEEPPSPPVWTPKSAGSSPTVERKEFRPVNFESPKPSRRNKQIKSEGPSTPDSSSAEPPWKVPETSSDVGVSLSSSLEKRLTTSHSAPASGFSDFSTPRLPRAQNPTITLLQRAREGRLQKGANYTEQEEHSIRKIKNDRPPIVEPGEIIYQIKNEYTSESENERPRKMADLGPRKFEGIGPTTKDGMPIILRSEIRDANQSKWYKRMYDTIHKQRNDDEYVTVRYKQRRARYPYSSGYLSEPEPGAYDSDNLSTDYKYATLDRRRLQPARDKDNDYVSSTMPRSVTNKYTTSSDIIKHGQGVYKNQPGRIENYIPGHSSISEKEAKEWWDEVMDIFDGHLEQQKYVPPQNRSYMSQALKESGYESDSTLIFRRRDDTAQKLSPQEQKEAYKSIQKGGDVPLHGLRKPAPERPKEPEGPVPPPKGHHVIRNPEAESPRKYVENEVTIHYRTPVRQEIKESLSEEELARRQAEAMKKIYQEERRRKYLQVSKSLQELQDMNSRRHTDNFIPSQKSPISLNRYDDFVDDLSPKIKPRPRSPEPRLVAKALYNFVGQSARELTFRKGDIIYIRRQVDRNWYEGEHNAMIGLFPANYVEIVPYDGIKTTPRKPYEGQARAKYNFIAQTHLELSLAKGELVVITRRVDDNWFEGKIGGRKGIFPVSYVEVLIDPSDPPPTTVSSKPVAAPAAHSLLLNGSSGGKESMGSHSYTPNFSSPQLTTSYHAKPVQITGGGSYGSLSKSSKSPINQTLHVDTQSEPVPYRALYKYRPQNDDELELLEGDTVYVLEKCDDGWYVGSSERTGAFGTFPGNYVEQI